MTVTDQDYDDGWLYAAAMRIWHEIENDTKPREVVRIMREELRLSGGNPDARRPAQRDTAEIQRATAKGVLDRVRSTAIGDGFGDVLDGIYREYGFVA